MIEIMQAIEPATIGKTIEANINAELLSFARLPGTILHRDRECLWVDAGVGDPSFNAVVQARFGPDTADAGVEAVLAHFRARSRPVTWHLGPSTEPPNLGAILLAHGLAHSEDEPGMALEIAGMREGPAPPPGLTIEAVGDAAGLEEWVSVWLFPVHESIRRSVLGTLLQRGLGESYPWRYYLGRLEGRPVAILSLFMGEGMAAVHHVVTLSEVRRRGIGTAMTAWVLREAGILGYAVAVLTASPEGIGSYRRLGFREYCLFRRYLWEPGMG